MGHFTKIEKHMQNEFGTDLGEMQHSYRVVYNAAAIMEREAPCDTEIVCVSALLHDIGRAGEENSLKDNHARRSALLAAAYLQQLDWPEQRIKQVEHCIRCHSRKSGEAPESPEAKILYDADKLDLLGAGGLARMLQFAPDLPLYELDQAGAPAFNKSAESCFYGKQIRKMRKIKREMYTETGKLLAAERMHAAKRWLKALRSETEHGHKTAQKMGLL